MNDSTIQYYNTNAKKYYETTVSVDMEAIYQPFLKHLQPGAKILDAGCGSGRDSYYFQKQGFEVTAFDASKEMVKLSSRLLGQEVLLLKFENFQLPELYDGIWACASLLHVNKTNLVQTINTLANNLKPGGIFYMSFKYGEGDYLQAGRYFNCLTETQLKKVISKTDLRIDKISLTGDVRKEKEKELWLNGYLVKPKDPRLSLSTACLLPER